MLNASRCVFPKFPRLSSRAFFSSSTKPPLFISEEVADALAHGKPVVALETAILTHGMPFPTNLETVLSVESCVRESGAVPATIGVLHGRIYVGLNYSQLEKLADVKRTPAVKVSRRDLAAVTALDKNGGTTIAGTMAIAHLAGIQVFATGGLGGVHRGGETSMDISADLTELGKTPVAVIASGVKSILDIGRTLEYLETQGVPVITYGDSKDFPAFFTPKSGFQSPWNVSTPIEAAKIIYHGAKLNLTNGYFFGVPIPEAYWPSGSIIQSAIDRAVAESEVNGISKKGKEATPWLLQRVNELTAGASLKSNIGLIENTSRIGGKIAVELSKLSALEKPQRANVFNVSLPQDAQNKLEAKAKILVIGGAAVDIIAKPGSDINSPSVLSHTTVPGSISSSLGGVARNIAEAAHRVRSARDSLKTTDVLLVAPIGSDNFGRLLHSETRSLSMRTDGLISSPPEGKLTRTAVCNMILDRAGSLIGGVADMDIASSLEFIQVEPILRSHAPNIVALDGNLSSSMMNEISLWASKNKTPVLFEPTSTIKSTRILSAVSELVKHKEPPLPGKMPLSVIDFVSPNVIELDAIYQALETRLETETALRDWWWLVVDDLGLGQDYQSQLGILSRQPVSSSSTSSLAWLVEKGVARMIVQLLPFFQTLLIKCGDQGVLLATRVPNTPASKWAQQKTDPKIAHQIVTFGRSSIFVLKHFPPEQVDPKSIVNVTGAGDSLVGGFLSQLSDHPGLTEDPSLLDNAVRIAQRAAVQTLQSDLAVSPLLGQKI